MSDDQSISGRTKRELRRSHLQATDVSLIETALAYGEMLRDDPQRTLVECAQRSPKARRAGDYRLGEMLAVIAAVAADLVAEAET